MNHKNGTRFTLIAESIGQLLDTGIRFGLISGSAIAVAFGQFLLGGILGALAIGIFLRFKRGRVAN
uniref:Uncharacterized protein n=1 Tax=Dechloromonas aromatica (strain RCB) TaxID=159087 RepID=Q47EM2_DECAR